MMTMKDWISFLVGALLAFLGLAPMIWKEGFLSFSSIPEGIFPYILAVGGIYLIVNAFIEITNSNVMGWVSLIVGVVIACFGLLPFMKALLGPALIHILLIIDGLFLMIACFAMEL